MWPINIDPNQSFEYTSPNSKIPNSTTKKKPFNIVLSISLENGYVKMYSSFFSGAMKQFCLDI